MMGTFKAVDHKAGAHVMLSDGMLNINVPAPEVPPDMKWAEIYLEQMVKAIREIDLSVAMPSMHVPKQDAPVVNVELPELKPVVNVNFSVSGTKMFLTIGFPILLLAAVELVTWVIQ